MWEQLFLSLNQYSLKLKCMLIVWLLSLIWVQVAYVTDLELCLISITKHKYNLRTIKYYVNTDNIVLKVIINAFLWIINYNTKLWSKEVIILFHHVILYFHLVFIRIIGLFFLLLNWFRNQCLRFWTLFFFIWKQTSKKAWFLLFFLLLDIYTLLMNWLFHLHHWFWFHFIILL
jgi:hypothetical protein